MRSVWTSPSLRARARSAALAVGLFALTTRTQPLYAQRVTPATLEARAVDRADTIVTLRSGTKDLLAELRVPAGPGPHPVAIIIHGGCWVTRFADARYMKPMAEGLRQAGIATWTISYRRADEPGGGWPGTFTDIAAEVAVLRDLAPTYRLDLTRVIASGHSAGAHLALWLAAQRKLPGTNIAHALPGALDVQAVVALDGPGDLIAVNSGITRYCGDNVLEQLLASTPTSAPDRWRDASPSAFLPLGVPQAMVRGRLDASLPGTDAADGAMTPFALRARALGDSTWVIVADSTSHFAMLDPQHPAFAVVVQAMRDAIAAMRPARTTRQSPNR